VLSAGVVQALYDPVEVGDYLCYSAEGHVIGDVDARRQGEPDSDELRDDDVGDFDGRAGWGQAGTWLRWGNQRAGEVTDCHDHQWDPLAVVRAQPPAGPTPGRTGLQMIVTDDLVGSEGDLAKVVLKPGAFGRGECREESLAGRVRSAEVRQLAPGLVGGDNMTIAGGDQQPDRREFDVIPLLGRRAVAGTMGWLCVQYPAPLIDPGRPNRLRGSLAP